MSNKKQQIPDIRFKGFTDDWEQRKLGELINLENGFAFKSEYFQEDPSDVIVLTPGNVNIGGGFQSGKGRFYNIAGKFPDKFIFKPGDIFVTMTDLTPSGQTLGLPAIVPDDGITYLHNQRLGKLVNFSGDREFLFYVFNTEDYHKHIVATASGTTVKHSSSSKILDYVVHIPIIEEQTKIGAFLNKLDNTIALHQRKSTLLKQLKQTYLKQIFPQNKENIPALRFAGFSEPWKQHKFDEVFSHVQNNSLSRADLNYNGGYAMNIHYGDILIRFGEYLDVSKCKLPMIANKQLVEKYKASFLKDGDIVIADAAEDETVGKCSELRGIEDANILAGLHTIPSRPNWTFAPGYLGYYMNSSAFHDQLLPLIQGTKISSISKSALKKTDIKYPYGKEEQTKIGNLFKQLDDSISLHQSKLEKLTDLKQVLLAKMFV